MQKNASLVISGAIATLLFASVALALARSGTATGATQAIAAGQQLWQQLQAKQVSCSGLSDTNFENLGEYFMGQMMGNSHEAMNQTLASRLGESGAEQMHVVMGKRLSGCDASAAFPAGFQSFMPMMGMMGGSNYYGSNYTNPMMGYGYGYASMMGGVFGGFLSLVVLVDLILLGVWLWRQISKQ